MTKLHSDGHGYDLLSPSVFGYNISKYEHQARRI